MSQAPVGGVGRVRRKGAGANEPGSLSRDDDGEWDFTGNGQITAAQVTQRILDLEADKYSKDDIKLPPLSNAAEAQLSKDVAVTLLKDNPTLPQDPNLAIANGAKFSTNVAELKKALQPFLNNPNLENYLLHQISSSSATVRYGDVPSQGLILPYER